MVFTRHRVLLCLLFSVKLLPFNQLSFSLGQLASFVSVTQLPLNSSSFCCVVYGASTDFDLFTLNLYINFRDF